MIIMNDAAVFPIGPRSRKNSGIQIAAPVPKQISCRFVRLKRTFVLIFERSFGIGTYAIFHSPYDALNMDFARLPVLNIVKHKRIVYPVEVQTAVVISALTGIFAIRTA